MTDCGHRSIPVPSVHTSVVLHTGSSLQCAHKELNQEPHQLQSRTTFTAKDDCLESEMSRV